MATYAIKGKRYLRKYTAPILTPTYGVAGDVATMAANLCDCDWEAVDPTDACLPSHAEASLDSNVESRDYFDAAAFCAGHADGLHRVYGQAACYVFTLPDEAVGVSLSSLSAQIVSDPYCAAGARVAVHTSSTLTIPTDCATARTGSGYAQGVAPRTSTLNSDGSYTWTGATAAANITFDTPLTLQKYLMVVVAQEEYVGRAGYAEGSSYMRNAVTIETSAAISADGWTDGSTAAVDCTGTSAASSQRLITTSYSAGNGLTGSVNPNSSLRAHRVFCSGLTSDTCCAFIGGTCGGMAAPALLLTQSYNVSPAKCAQLELPESYRIADSSTGTTENDAAATWYDTVPGKALIGGVGVTGVFIAPLYGSTSIGRTSSESDSKHYTIFLSTKEGLYTIGGITMSNSGTHLLYPDVVRWGDGGDLLLVRKVGTTDSADDLTGLYEYHAECVSVGDGVITVGSRSIAYEGTVTGLGTFNGNGSGEFLVAGDLTSVGGMPVKHAARIDARYDELTVNTIGASNDAVLEPNCYDDFRVIRAGGNYYVLGSFTELGGVACAKGAATVESGTITPLTDYIADVVHITSSFAATVTANRATISIS